MVGELRGGCLSCWGRWGWRLGSGYGRVDACASGSCGVECRTACGRRFPRAEYVVQRDELEHVRGGSTYSNRDPGRSRTPGSCGLVDGEVVLRGMRLVPTPGHTPGHQSVVTERAILGGDVLVHPAQARWPELTYVYERDPAVAITSRHDVLALAAATGIPIAAAHPHAPLSVETAHAPVDPAQARLSVGAVAVPAGATRCARRTGFSGSRWCRRACRGPGLRRCSARRRAGCRRGR